MNGCVAKGSKDSSRGEHAIFGSTVVRVVQAQGMETGAPATPLLCIPDLGIIKGSQ